MRFPYVVVAFLTILPPCAGQDTLQEFLQSNSIPQTKFNQAELAEKINGAAARKGRVIYAVYLKVEGEILAGFPQLVRYVEKSGTVLRSTLKVGDKENCCGSPDGIEFVDNDPVLSFHYNPSASTLLVLNQNLDLVEIMYGFDVRQIAPHQIVMTEGMVQFAPIHADRLQLVDLSNGATQELYPPSDDPVRAEFNKKNKKYMPPDDICRSSDNDYCDPDLYDEDTWVAGTDGGGRFALVAGWSSNHTIKKGDYPVTVASESVLYLYKHGEAGWLYCNQAISSDEAHLLTSDKKNDYEGLKTRCIPDRKVVPDMSTSDLSPFPAPVRVLK